jgi:hypothetical protein
MIARNEDCLVLLRLNAAGRLALPSSTIVRSLYEKLCFVLLLSCGFLLAQDSNPSQHNRRLPKDRQPYRAASADLPAVLC